jgi:NitT/TauT family transport system permease protein
MSSPHSDQRELPGALTWRERNGRRVAVYALRLALLAVVIVVWQLVVSRMANILVVSKPSLVWQQLRTWASDGTLWRNSWVTIKEIVLGFVFGSAAGIVLGFALSLFRLVSSVVDPFIMSLYAIPKVALAPLFIVWFGIELKMKVILTAVTVFFVVFLNTAAGIKQVDGDLIDAVRLMGGSRMATIRKVVVPASMAGVLTGLRISVPYAVIGAVIGELVASNQGLGYLIDDSASTLNTAGVFAALVVLTVIAAILNALVNILGGRTERWRPSDPNL